MSHSLYRPVELAFEARSALPVGLESPLTVTFRHADSGDFAVPGFWDGGTTYRVRFAPDLEGEWSWTTESAASALSVVHDHSPSRSGAKRTR